MIDTNTQMICTDTGLEVKPCPFCGQDIDTSSPDFCYPVTKTKSIWRAGCIECHGGCGAEILGSTPKEAIEKWNTRV